MKDVKNSIETIKDIKWLIEKDLFVIWPDPIKWVWLLWWIITNKGPQIDTDKDIACYWLSSGTWGMYYEGEDAIGICPWKLNLCEDTLEELIIHEITHLEHPEAEEMDHEDKERYIENIVDQKKQ